MFINFRWLYFVGNAVLRLLLKQNYIIVVLYKIDLFAICSIIFKLFFVKINDLFKSYLSWRIYFQAEFKSYLSCSFYFQAELTSFSAKWNSEKYGSYWYNNKSTFNIEMNTNISEKNVSQKLVDFYSNYK